MPQLLLPNPKGASIIAVTGADGGLGAHAPGAEVRVQQFQLRAVAQICLKQVQFLNTVITWTWTSLAECRFIQLNDNCSCCGHGGFSGLCFLLIFRYVGTTVRYNHFDILVRPLLVVVLLKLQPRHRGRKRWSCNC